MFKRIIKGDFGYIKKKRTRVIIWTIIMFALAIGIFLTGYITTGTKKNLLTVVAILGCLPACKSAISMIMFIKATPCSESLSRQIEEHVKGLISMYDMYFTSYDNNFPILHMIVQDRVVIGYYENPKFNEEKCISHLTTMLKTAGHNGVTISLTKDLDKYLNMLDNMSLKADTEGNTADDEIRISLYEITL